MRSVITRVWRLGALIVAPEVMLVSLSVPPGCWAAQEESSALGADSLASADASVLLRKGLGHHAASSLLAVPSAPLHLI